MPCNPGCTNGTCDRIGKEKSSLHGGNKYLDLKVPKDRDKCLALKNLLGNFAKDAAVHPRQQHMQNRIEELPPHAVHSKGSSVLVIVRGLLSFDDSMGLLRTAQPRSVFQGAQH